MDRKVGAAVPLSVGGWAVVSTEAYLHTKWYPDPSSLLAGWMRIMDRHGPHTDAGLQLPLSRFTDAGKPASVNRESGGCFAYLCRLRTKWYPTVWPQYTNVTCRQTDRQTDRQRSDSI